MAMRFWMLTVFVISAAFCQTPWKDAADLPGVDLTGLTPAQTKAALLILRENGCVCGCNMKIAQCRIEDPPCTYSKKLASVVIQGVRDGKNSIQIRDLLADSGIQPSPQKLLEDPVKLPIEGAPSKGPANARITLVEFSDFQCPYCAIAVEKANTLLKAHPNDVRLVFKQFPLDSHSQAKLAAEAALAAHAQGKFWPMHDKMYANFRNLSRPNILGWAKEIGMDMPKFTADLDSGKYRSAVDSEAKQGEQAGVFGTPTFFINGQRLNTSIEAAGPIIDQELKKTAKK